MSGIDHFHQLETEQAIIRSGGGFEQVDIYQRRSPDVATKNQTEIYIRKGSKYFRLLENNKTSHPTTFWDQLSISVKVGMLGRLVQA